MLTQIKKSAVSVVNYDFLYYYKYSVCKRISATTSKLNYILQFDH